MPKREKHRFVLSDYKDKKEQEGSIEIDCGEGRVFTIPPPELWSDEALSSAEDPVRIGALVLGEETYEQFKAAGGTGGLLLSMIGDVHGITPGE